MAAWWEGAIWRGADALVAVSSPLGRDLVEQGFALRPERLRVMPMAVDTARFFPRLAPRADTPLAPHVPPGWCAVIYSGALTAWHGIESFFGIAEQFRDSGDPIKLIALGGEALHVKKYATCVEERGLGQHLSFVGSVPHAQVPEWLAAADVGFIAHTSEYSSPTKMFEYMASGLPVVAPDLPAIREVLGTDDAMGALFDGSEAGAVAALRLLAYGREELGEKQVNGGAGLRQERGQAARKAAEDQHSWDSVAKSIESFYGELVRR
jgi:glycosyltransferase involved in cell wall biosynthesis